MVIFIHYDNSQGLQCRDEDNKSFTFLFTEIMTYLIKIIFKSVSFQIYLIHEGEATNLIGLCTDPFNFRSQSFPGL